MNILQQIAALLGGKLTKVHEKTVANKEAIEDEVRRAKASETLLDTNIKNETKRAQDEETRIELKAVDLVNAEETRATKAESDLSTKIDTDVKAEADRAKGAEQAIIGNLNAETARAKAAEKANSDAITSLDEKKVDKVEGKQLSTEDYTTAEKTKVGNLGKYTTSDIYERVMAGSQDMYLEYKVKNPETGEIQTYDTILHKVSDTHNGLMTPAQKLVIDNLLSGDSALSILGTPSQTWQLNLGSGPKLKNSGGVFELRNAADNAYADLTVNALTIKGNVTQEGGSFITQAETVSAKDNTILLNSGETGAGVTKGIAGVEIDRGTLPKYKFVFDESDDRFKVGSEGDLWSVMLRDNESDLTNGGILTWDATTKRAKTAFNIDDLADTYLPLAGGTMTGPIYIAPLTEGVTNGIQASPGTWSGDNSILTYDASVVDFGPSNALLNIWGTEIALNPTTATDIVFNTSSSNNLVHKIQRKKYLIYDEHNLDISQFAKAADYIPLKGNSTTTPITGHLYTEDVFGWGMYGMKIEGADGLPRTAHIQFNANQTGAMGSEPAKSNAYTEMGSIGEVWGPNTVSQLRVGYEDNLPVLKYRNNPEGPEIKEYNIYHEGNLDVNSMVSGFLPLSGTEAGKPVTGKIEIEDNLSQGGFYGKSIEHSDGITRGTRILFDNISGSDSASIVTLGCTGTDNNYRSMLVVGHYKHRPMLRFDYHDGDSTSQLKRAMVYHEGNLDITKYALKTDLDNIDMSNYLPLSGGTMTGDLLISNNTTIWFMDSQPSMNAAIGYQGTTNTLLIGVHGGREGKVSFVGDVYHSDGGKDYKIWDEGNDGAGSGLDADLLDGKQGSEYALASNLSSYLPLSAGSSKPLTGSLFAQGITNSGPNGFNLSIITGNSTVGSSGVECDCNGLSVGFGANNNGIAYFWVGGNSSSEKSYYASVSKASKSVDFLYRPTFGGEGLAKLSEIPTSLPANGGNADSVGNTNLKIYPYSSNEINFGGAGTPTDIYFGYRTMDGRPIPTSYRFGSTSNGTATLYAANFILAGKQVATTDQIPTNVLTHHGHQVNVNISRGTGVYSFSSAVPGTPNGYAYGSYLQWGNTYDLAPGTTGHWINQLVGTTEDLLYYRTRTNDGNWTGWKRIAYINEIPTSMAWGSITGKPSFATVATSGSYNDLSNKPNIPSIPSSLPANGGTSTYSTYLRVNDLRASAIAPTYGENNIVGWFNNLGTPDGNWWSGIHVKGWTTTYSAWQLAGPSYDSAPASDALWFRSGKDSSWNGWRRVAFANEIPTTLPASDVYSWAKAASKPSYGWTEITGKPASMPASDVYAWAKASSKPSYAWSEITGKPTIPSLSGYATEAWVNGRGFLTSHQSLANYVTLNTAQTISGAKTFTSFVTCSAGAGTSSDIRLKKYVNRMFDAEELLSNLSGYRYIMKKTDMHYAGLIAQEVQEVLPEAVREDGDGFLTVDTYPIVAALVEANKAKDNRIKALEDRITTLEKKMNMILNKLG